MCEPTVYVCVLVNTLHIYFVSMYAFEMKSHNIQQAKALLIEYAHEVIVLLHMVMLKMNISDDVFIQSTIFNIHGCHLNSDKIKTMFLIYVLLHRISNNVHASKLSFNMFDDIIYSVTDLDNIYIYIEPS